VSRPQRPRLGIRGRLAGAGAGQLLAATIGGLLALAAGCIGGALVSDARLNSARGQLLDHVEPSLRFGLALEAALINEETGVRGYIITAVPSFLGPYRDGLAREHQLYASLNAAARTLGAPLPRELASVRARVAAWRTGYVTPELRRVARRAHSSIVPSLQARRLFDGIRASLAELRAALTAKAMRARAHVHDAALTLRVLLYVVAALVLGSVLGAGLLLSRTVTHPLRQLRAAVTRVGRGDVLTPIPEFGGPREVTDLSEEIETMRDRLAEELAAVAAGRTELEQRARELAQSNAELERSNAELEQFAYVASHDLQEPLRKIASFCQALQERYHGQLDERADQYIDFAVDGAVRMQSMIGDLLAFSRVGRGGRKHSAVPLGDVVDAALSALATTLEETGAQTRIDALPTVVGDELLLRSLFQNLIGNAVKFRGAEQPVITITARRAGESWLLSCSDNGIGIAPEYAERIFLIFQRLHSRSEYGGSGIGLALARKIVDYHGGRIWLDTGYAPGARFCFTLPATAAEAS
jgi:signal transduction histidine kinase